MSRDRAVSRFMLMVLVLVLVLASGAEAQTATPTRTPTPIPTATFSARRDCGNGLPCGAIPWQLPNIPALASPTPFPTLIFTATPSPTPSATLTPTPSATWTPGGATATPAPSATLTPTATPDVGDIDTAPIGDALATFQAVLGATQPAILVSGTPMGDIMIAGLESTAQAFFERAKGVGAINLGKISPAVNWLLFAFGFVLFVTVTTLVLPVLVAIFGIIRKAVQIVLDFLPL